MFLAIRRVVLLVGAVPLALAGCLETSAPTPVQAVPPAGPKLSASVARSNYNTVVRTLEPVAERVCRSRIPNANCDFLIRIDPDASKQANAYQSLSDTGRPLITFTQALLLDVRNQDELAFIMGHEAAHHIEGHIPQQVKNANAGAVVATIFGAALGASEADIRELQNLGAFVGARSYSKDAELEADALGTVIAARSGYDPVRGSAYFARIPDPGNTFLGTHPANGDRQKIVRQTAAGL